MSTRRLNSDFSMNAYWTINDSDYEFGILKYNQGKIIIELPNSEIEFDSTYKKITGSNNRNLFSLFKVRVTKRADKELSMVHLQAEYMFIDNKHIVNLEDFKISSINWTTDRLPLLLHGSVWQNLEDERGIRYSKIPVEEYDIKSLKAKISINFSYSSRSNITPEDGLIDTFKSRPYFTINYEEKKSILDIKEDVRKISNLLTVLTGSPQTIRFFNYQSTTKDLLGNEIPKNGEFYFIQSYPSRKNFQIDSAYSFNNISKKFGEILSVYFEKYDKIANIIIHILLMTSAKNMLEASYIDVVTSLEAFHRDSYNYEKEFSKETENVILKINEYIDENSSDKNKKQRNELNKISYNVDNVRKPTLQDRIADLLKKLPNSLKNKLIYSNMDFCDKKETNKFSEKVAVSRNHLAHGSRKETTKKFTSTEMLNVTYILTIISEYFLMSTFGLKDEIIIEGIRHKNIYQKFLTDLYDFEQPFR